MGAVLKAVPGELIEAPLPSSYRSAILLLPRGLVLAELSHLSPRVAVRWAFRSGRFRELVLLVLAALIGCLSGGVVTLMSWITSQAHHLLYQLDGHMRLSEQDHLASPWLALVPLIGGLVIAGLNAVFRHTFTRPPVDPIEANALYGGRMSVGESLYVALQTMVSSGFGASVGLEAGYTQASSGLASRVATALKLRRPDVRMLVGCAAAGAIAAAFSAPITGAFYGFELIIGTYTVALVAPVLAAALAASLTAGWLGAVQTPILIGAVPPMTALELAPYLALGVLGGLAAVGVMQLVSGVERLFRVCRCPAWARPAIAGAAIGGLALISPHVLSSGHGALHVDLAAFGGWPALLMLFGLKMLASALSLGGGFRGGLFFASLYLGALLGKAYALMAAAAGLSPLLAPTVSAVVGMASIAVGVVGGPMTMSFLVLETTHDFAITGAVLVASIMSAVVVRETFGYSFSTWRLHLRGETIRSAHDVGWIRNLTVARMMRADIRTAAANQSLETFRKTFPLGSTQRVILVGDQDAYAGIVLVADAYQPGTDADAQADISSLARHRDSLLLPSMTADAAARVFRSAQSEELAVVESLHTRKVVGLLTEQHLLRRYAEELDRARRDLTGGAA
ncbi:chloride channel protein [Oryzibacter oryziterrae]|uniref:chloride channel protein n=1 Tax=Oryzibacter oryziterrae TaxID=2766474 RepID=UPI001F3D116B|nr:chloride channel protein [Oryzibacter oryziterrae]